VGFAEALVPPERGESTGGNEGTPRLQYAQPCYTVGLQLDPSCTAVIDGTGWQVCHSAMFSHAVNLAA
jgi:hypothetical protein